MNEPRQPLSRHPLVQEQLRRRAESGEDAAVGHILSHYGLTAAKRELLAIGRREFGRPRLTLALFNRFFPDFPIALHYCSATRLREQLTVTRWLTKAEELRPVQELRLCGDLEQESHAVIFSWPTVKYLALHNFAFPPCDPGRNYQGLRTEDGIDLYLDRLTALLEAVAWRPSDT